MATAKKRSKKTSAGRSAAAKKTTATRTSAARKSAATAARKSTGKGAKTATRKPGPTAGKVTGKKAVPKATRAPAGKASKAAAPKQASKKATAKASKKAAPTATSKATRTAAPKATMPAKKKAATSRKATPTAAKKTATTARAGKAAKAPARNAAGAASRRPRPTRAASPPVGSPVLFESLTEGERAAALRILTEDHRLAGMANVGRYRVIAVEPLVVKPSHGLADRRLARVVAYDYAAERSVDACIDLDGGAVTNLHIARTQPMLAREEEDAAIAIALADEQVRGKLSATDVPQVATHYWSPAGTSLAYSRRSAAVLFGQPGMRPSLVAVVDLLDNLVCEIVPAAEW